MKKKIIALCLCAAMISIAVIGGTLAYFTDTEKETNTMVIGDVKINIDEFTYLENENGELEWKPFEDDKFILYPIENAQGNEFLNKIVYTANTSEKGGKAYIRNIVLIEANDLLDANYANEGDCCVAGLHFRYDNRTEPTVSQTDGKTYYGSTNELLDETVTINGEKYWVVVFTEATGKAIPEDAALMTLSGVWMDKNITSEQIAGWGQDGKVDIIVFSQGIQETGLTHDKAMEELGEVSESNLQTWLDAAEEATINDWTDKSTQQ